MLKELTHQQKLIIFSVLSIVVVLLIFKFAIYPIFSTSTNLERRIAYEKSLHQYLQQSKQQLQHNKIFVKTTTPQAKKIISQQFNNVKNTIQVKKGAIVMTMTNQNFNHILNHIANLKNNHGIVVSKAKFIKQTEGIINASLTFNHP